MRILVVIAHYFGQKAPGSPGPLIGSEIEPLSRIAGLNECIVALHRNFGRTSRTVGKVDLSNAAALRDRVIDIVIVTKSGNSLLAYIGIGPDHYRVEQVDDGLRIPFHAQGVIRAARGRYDFYCVIEDDLVIRDPDFFAKLAWFQEHFGPKALLAPVRYEMSASGTLARVVIDPQLNEVQRGPFRRPGQRAEIGAQWRGQTQQFALPANPHAASYFLTGAQLDCWLAQPSFLDGDTSWIGPLESAMTLSVGKVFDIYKPTAPDPFFLSIEHYGARLAIKSADSGQVYGDPPLLEIARSVVRAATANGGANGREDLAGLQQFVGLTAARKGERGRPPGLAKQVAELRARLRQIDKERAALRQRLAGMERSNSWRLTGPLRWLKTKSSVFRKGSVEGPQSP